MSVLVQVLLKDRCSPFSCEFALLVGCDELGRQAVGAQVQGTLGTPAHVVNQRDCLLVELILVVELVLDGVQVDEVAHACARVPANVVRVHVHLPEELDHLVAVCNVLLRAGSRCGKVCGTVVLPICLSRRDLREGERICDFQDAILLHADQAARG